jgi:hypothetical protein
MVVAASNLVHLVRYLVNVSRCTFVSKRTKTELPTLPAAARKKSTNVIQECGVLGAAVNENQIRPVVVLEVDQFWTEQDSHAS